MKSFRKTQRQEMTAQSQRLSSAFPAAAACVASRPRAAGHPQSKRQGKRRDQGLQGLSLSKLKFAGSSDPGNWVRVRLRV